VHALDTSPASPSPIATSLMKTEDPAASATPIVLVLLVWFAVASAASASGALAKLRPPAPQLVAVLLTLSSVAAVLLVPRLRAWTDQVSIRALVAIHLTRFVGAYLIQLGRSNTLPARFAIPAGLGDLLVATLAVLLLACVPTRARRAHALYYGWNILGLIDILFVLLSAARTGLVNPGAMQPLLHLPLSLLPTFLVPVVITTHILIFRRLRIAAVRT